MTTENSKKNPSIKPLVILPAAGFGSRVGFPEAKELILGPSGEPLITLALNQARLRKWPVHVITRKEKKSLIEFLEYYSDRNQMEIGIQIIDPSQEWPETVLQSQEVWHDKNLLCLPDTEFEPVEIWDRLIENLQGDVDVAMAVFESQDYGSWGVVRSLPDGRLEICEKPQGNQERPLQKENIQAWGLSAFTKRGGVELLSVQLKSTFDHSWVGLRAQARLFKLAQFRDLTRG